MPLRDLEVLHYRKVKAAEGRSIQRALLQRALSARLRVEEYLSSERCGAIGRNATSIRTNIRRVQPVRSIAGHEQSSNLVYRCNREAGIDSVIAGACASIERAASRQDRDRAADNPISYIIWRRSTNTILLHIDAFDTRLPEYGANNAAPDKTGRWVSFASNSYPPEFTGRATAVWDTQTNTWQYIHHTGAEDDPHHGYNASGFTV